MSQRRTGRFHDLVRVAARAGRSIGEWMVEARSLATGEQLRFPLPADGELIAALVKNGAGVGEDWRVMLRPIATRREEVQRLREQLRKLAPGAQRSVVRVPRAGGNGPTAAPDDGEPGAPPPPPEAGRAPVPPALSSSSIYGREYLEQQRRLEMLKLDIERKRQERELAKLEEPTGGGQGQVVALLMAELAKMREQLAELRTPAPAAGAAGLLEVARLLLPAIQSMLDRGDQRHQAERAEAARREQMLIEALQRGASAEAPAPRPAGADLAQLGTMLPVVRSILEFVNELRDSAAPAAEGDGTLAQVNRLVETLGPHLFGGGNGKPSAAAPKGPPPPLRAGTVQTQPPSTAAAPPARRLTDPAAEGKRRVAQVLALLEREGAIGSDPAAVVELLEQQALPACPAGFRDLVYKEPLALILSNLPQWVEQEEYTRLSATIAEKPGMGAWLAQFVEELQRTDDGDDDDAGEDAGEADDGDQDQ